MATLNKRPSHVILDSLERVTQSFRDHSLELEQRIGLSAPELFILQQLQSLSPVSLKGLATSAMADADSVALVVGALAEKGLAVLRRSDKNGRLLEAWISAEGKLKIRQCPDSLQFRFIAAVESLGEAQRISLASGLAALLEVAGIS